MEFLNPAALYALGLVPLLAVPYLVGRRPRRHLFSSLLVLRACADATEPVSRHRLRAPLLFLLQACLLALLAASSADPVVPFQPSGPVGMVLDNSASMQAVEQGRSRFALARAEARKILAGLPAGTRVDLYASVPWGRAAGSDLSADQARERLERMVPYDLGDGGRDDLPRLRRLAAAKGYRRVYFVTDRPVLGSDPVVHAVSVGRPADNLGVTSLDLYRRSLGSGVLSARVEVTNYGARPRRVAVVLTDGSRPLARKQARAPAGGKAAVVFEEVREARYYEARLDLDRDRGGDALALDDRRFAVPPGTGRFRVLGVSPRPDALATLRRVPGLELEVVGPDAYERSPGAPGPVEVFHLSSPAALPAAHALFILPPEGNPLASLREPVASPSVSGWKDPHAWTRYVNLALLRPRYGRPLAPGVGAPVIEGPAGTLAAAFKRGGFRYAVLGFDPLPFMGRRNLPMSILTLNLLGWLREGVTGMNGSTGDVLGPVAGPLHAPEKRGSPPAGASRNLEDAVPDGRNGSPSAGASDASASAPVLFQGVYEIGQGDRGRLVGVNFEGREEADLLHPRPLALEGTKAAASEVEEGEGYRRLWRYGALAAFLLLLLDLLLDGWSGTRGARGRRVEARPSTSLRYAQDERG